MRPVIFVILSVCVFAHGSFARTPIDCAYVACREPDSCPGGAVPIQRPGECCGVCPDPLNCAAVSCLVVDCPGAFVPPGQCCPQCPDCSRVRCAAPPDCGGVYVPPGQCCAQCPDCTTVRCPQVLDCPGGAQSYIPPGECCAVCPDVPVDPCASSPCLNGATCNVLGNTFTCECKLGFRGKYCETGTGGKPGTCPVTSGPGICVETCTSDNDCAGNQKCCSNGCGHVCMDPVVSGCTYKGQTYADGEQFMDECNQCFCRNGLVRCTKIGCPPGGCVYKNKWYAHEATFTDDCNTCTCNMGAVSCTEKACGGCVHNGVTYPVGSTYKVDCNTCTCQSSGVSICTLMACIDCRVVRCARPQCDYPVIPPGGCCDVCDLGCNISGVVYNEGDQVTCEDRCGGPCFCRGGNIEAQRRSCPPTICRNPFTPRGACCPICRGRWLGQGNNPGQGQQQGDNPGDNPVEYP